MRARYRSYHVHEGAATCEVTRSVVCFTIFTQFSIGSCEARLPTIVLIDVSMDYYRYLDSRDYIEFPYISLCLYYLESTRYYDHDIPVLF